MASFDIALGDGLAVVSVVLLLALAAVHVYWGAGGAWPARDRVELVELVVGKPRGEPFPSASACALVALLLVATAALVSGVRWARPGGGVEDMLRIGVWGSALVLTLRGAGGLAWGLGKPHLRALRFFRYNLFVYSPLALTLGLSIAGASFFTR
jgi:hypothetical protein